MNIFRKASFKRISNRSTSTSISVGILTDIYVNNENLIGHWQFAVIPIVGIATSLYSCMPSLSVCAYCILTICLYEYILLRKAGFKRISNRSASKSISVGIPAFMFKMKI